MSDPNEIIETPAETALADGLATAADWANELWDALDTAVELFEDDPECNKVGTDAWTWLHIARDVLRGPRDATRVAAYDAVRKGEG